MPFTYLPFLYQTRTILRPCHAPTLRRAFHAIQPQHSKSKGNDIPFVDNVDDELDAIPIEGHKDFDVESSVAKPPIRKPPPGTVTPSEQATFAQIFADIKARGMLPSIADDDPSQPRIRRSINQIIQSATTDINQHRPAIISPAFQAGAAKDRQKALLRFPPSLRNAAKLADEILKPQAESGSVSVYTEEEALAEQEQWETPANSLMRDSELSAKRYIMRTRVEELMYAAKSDFELWDVMEKEVFSMPDGFGIRKPERVAKKEEPVEVDAEGEPLPQAKKKPKMPSKKQKKKAIEATISEPKLSLYVHGPLYSEFLLLGLRLLDTAFASPSRLALSVLPRIKELGLESFLLGVSTPFYNALLEIYYGRYGDLSKMLDLLEEMRHSGLYFDPGTTSILNKVQNETDKLSEGRLGTFAEAIMTMPEYEKAVRDRIKHWQKVIDISVKQDVDLDYSKLAALGHTTQ